MKSDKTKQQFGYIYKTTCLLTKMFYVGQRRHHDPENDSYLGSGVRFQQALKKHGKENFVKEILITIKFNQDILNKLETKLINKHNACDPKIGYNNLPSHVEGFSGINPTQVPEILEKHKKSQKKRWSGKRGKIAKEEARQKTLAYYASEEGKKAIEERRLKAIKQWENKEYIKKNQNGQKKYWDVEENRDKVSEKSKEKWQDEDYIKKQSKSRRKAWKGDKERKVNFINRMKIAKR